MNGVHVKYKDETFVSYLYGILILNCFKQFLYASETPFIYHVTLCVIFLSDVIVPKSQTLTHHHTFFYLFTDGGVLSHLKHQ